MNKLVYKKSDYVQGGTYPSYERYISDIDKMPEYDVIRDNPRFKAAYGKLTTSRPNQP